MATASSALLRHRPTITPKPSSPRRLSRRAVRLPASFPLPRPAFPVLSVSLPAGRATGRIRIVTAAVRNENADGDAEVDTGESTMPERFAGHIKEAPEKPPPRWPWLVAAVTFAYVWRTVLWELSNWKKAAIAVVHFLGYIGKLILAFIYHFLGTPITATIQFVEFVVGYIYSIYSSIIAYVPVPELTNIILLTSAVLSIAESASPDAVNKQKYLLAAAGLVGFVIVDGRLSGAFFMLLLLSSFCFSKFVRGDDFVTAALPAAALLVAIGEPWVRALTMAAYLALAIFHHSRIRSEKNGDGDESSKIGAYRPPFPLLLAALSMGIHLGAKWIRQRHLTWMIT